MFERQDSRWLVTVLNHKETDKIIITYWLLTVSDKFSTIKIQPLHSLDHGEMLPEILIDAVEMEFEIQQEEAIHYNL